VVAARIETIIRIAAVGAGVMTLVAPVWVLLRVSGTSAAGEGEGESPYPRPWGILVATIFLVVIGVILWRPSPIVFSERVGLSLSLLGGLVYFPAIGMYLWGLRSLGSMFRVSSAFGARLPKHHALVEHGPYRVIRHPMYLGVILAAAGALLIFRTWAMVLFFPLSFVVVARAQREEQVLSISYGQAWREYTGRVPGWIPRVR